MPAVIGNIDDIVSMEKELRSNYQDYLSVCNSIQNSFNSLKNWTGFDNYVMMLRAGQGLRYFKNQAIIINNQADYLYRWRVNISNAQDTMLNLVSRLG